MTTQKLKSPKSRRWGKLLFFAFMIWIFGWVVGPYIQSSIPIYKQIVQVIEEQNIDSAGYMYKSAVGSYDGEYYLVDSFKHSHRSDWGPTVPFFAGILSCFAILWIGWRYVM